MRIYRIGLTYLVEPTTIYMFLMASWSGDCLGASPRACQATAWGLFRQGASGWWRYFSQRPLTGKPVLSPGFLHQLDGFEREAQRENFWSGDSIQKYGSDPGYLWELSLFLAPPCQSQKYNRFRALKTKIQIFGQK
jgi:hypothetical protein